MNATHRSPLKLVKQSVGWNNAKEQICNQCMSRLSRYLWFTYESGGIFPTSSAVARSRFSAGVAITNISMQLALLHSELDYLTYNWTSRHGTGYTFTWPRPTVEPLWFHRRDFQTYFQLISLKISLKFVPKVRINSSPALVQIMVWRRPGDKPLSEPMSGISLTHICVTRPQWVNTLRPRQNGRHFARHFQMYFLEWKYLNSDQNFIEVGY